MAENIENAVNAGTKPIKVKKRRGPGRPFKPGQSGNPGGRPKGVVNRIKALAGEDGKPLLELLYNMAMGTLVGQDGSIPSWKDRREAAVELLDRGWGRPVQPLSGDDGQGPIKIVIEKYGGAE